MKQKLIRENPNEKSMIFKFKSKKVKIYDYLKFLKNNNFDGLIKIPKEDYEKINKNLGFFTHFNLENSNHKKGKTYLLAKIIEKGYYKSKEDYKLPVLSLDNVLVCKCIDVKEKLKYSSLKSENFKYSLKNIKNVDDLKLKIIKTYSKSLPNISKEEIISRGISKTDLKIIGEFDGNFEKMSRIDFIDEGSFSSMREGFGDGVVEARKKNKRVVALTADLKFSLKLEKFEKLFKKDFFEFSISEQNMMSSAAGMCLNDKIPFVTSFAVFNPGRNWDQIRSSICYSNHNVKIIGSHAGLTTGEDGATHQALEDIAMLRALPNMVIIVPADYEQTKRAVIEASKYEGPIYIRLSREKTMNIFEESDEFKIGKGIVLDEGNDLTIFANGTTLQFALEARRILKNKYGISSTLINLHTVKPLDKELILKFAKKTKAFITIEEHQKIGGLGSAISEFLSENFPIPVEIIGINDSFGESGDGYELLKKYKISTEEIVRRAKQLLIRKNENKN